MAQGDILLKYGSATELTWTSGGPASLADATLTSLSDTLTITGNTIIDVAFQMKVKTIAGTLIAPKSVTLLLAGSLDDTNYPEAVVDTLSVTAVQLIQAADTSEFSDIFMLSQAFGGNIPPYVKAAMFNDSGLALSSTANDVELFYALIFGFVSPS